MSEDLQKENKELRQKLSQAEAKDKHWAENHKELWDALALIREAVADQIVGALPAEEHLEPSPMIEAEAIVTAVQRIVSDKEQAEADAAAMTGVCEAAKSLTQAYEDGNGVGIRACEDHLIVRVKMLSSNPGTTLLANHAADLAAERDRKRTKSQRGATKRGTRKLRSSTNA